jgi:hypothetical protein
MPALYGASPRVVRTAQAGGLDAGAAAQRHRQPLAPSQGQGSVQESGHVPKVLNTGPATTVWPCSGTSRCTPPPACLRLGLVEPSSTPPGRVMAVSRPQPWSLTGLVTSIPSAWRAVRVAATSSHSRYSSVRPPASAEWTAISAGAARRSASRLPHPPTGCQGPCPGQLEWRSPLRRLYSLYFPGYLDPATLQYLGNQLGPEQAQPADQGRRSRWAWRTSTVPPTTSALQSSTSTGPWRPCKARARPPGTTMTSTAS